MLFSSFIKGCIIGFSVAAPIGPVSLLCAGISFSEGMMTGFLSSLGASSADVLYGLLAVSGLAAIKGFLVQHRLEIKLIGGLLIVLIGLYRFFSKHSAMSIRHDHGCERPLKGFFAVFFATLSNPFTIVFFVTVFSSLGIPAYQRHSAAPALFLAGIFAGTASWWLIFSIIVGILRKNLHERQVQIINRISALLIAGLGLFAMLR